MACSTCSPSLLAQTGYSDALAPSASLSLAATTSDGSFSFSVPWLLVLIFIAMYAGKKAL